MCIRDSRYPGLGVESEVHRLNTYMLRINSGLLAETTVNADSREYLVTFVKAIVVPEDEDMSVTGAP